MSATLHSMPVDDAIVRVRGLSKTYAGGFQALKNVNLDIRRGEIFALLGPNGAGKTTLISVICGMTNATEGSVTADGHDTVRDYRAARAAIGLVPQELHTDSFETVWATVSFSRGLFGKAPNPALIEKILKDLSLWDKRDTKILALSGGMKRRVLIAKALSHEPKILFLDEPSAGVDVELRHDMWRLVRALRDAGTTIILTTHYIEEAEDMADRIGVIRQGELLLVEDIDDQVLREKDPTKLIPPLHGALLKNEQDVHLFERLQNQSISPYNPLRSAQLLWATLHGLAQLSRNGLFVKREDLAEIAAHALAQCPHRPA